MAVARDKFWIFGVRPHQDDRFFSGISTGRDWSRITPGEAALMLDVPNMLMVNCDGIPVPYSVDAYGYAESFCTMKNVLWGATGSAGFRVGNEEAFICDLAEKYPNIKGAFMDDFFDRFENQPDGMEKAESLLREIREGLSKSPRPLDLYVVWYTHQFKEVPAHLLEYIDGISLWTSKAEELLLLEERFCAIEKNFPSHKKLLGIYMFEFSTRRPIPIDLMEHQCELGLRLMKEGRLDGMIFEANSVMGIGLESELWLRKWIMRNKLTEVPD